MDLRYAVDCRKTGMFAVLGSFTQPMRRDKKVTTFLQNRGVLVGTWKSPVVVDVTSRVSKDKQELAKQGYFMVLDSHLLPGSLTLTHEIGDDETPFFRENTPKNVLEVYRNSSYSHFIVSFKEGFGDQSSKFRQTVVTPAVKKWLEDDENYSHPNESPESRFIQALISKKTF